LPTTYEVYIFFNVECLAKLYFDGSNYEKINTMQKSMLIV